jgi:hypothetical protein
MSLCVRKRLIRIRDAKVKAFRRIISLRSPDIRPARVIETGLRVCSAEKEGAKATGGAKCRSLATGLVVADRIPAGRSGTRMSARLTAIWPYQQAHLY